MAATAANAVGQAAHRLHSDAAAAVAAIGIAKAQLEAGLRSANPGTLAALGDAATQAVANATKAQAAFAAATAEAGRAAAAAQLAVQVACAPDGGVWASRCNHRELEQAVADEAAVNQSRATVDATAPLVLAQQQLLRGSEPTSETFLSQLSMLHALQLQYNGELSDLQGVVAVQATKLLRVAQVATGSFTGDVVSESDDDGQDARLPPAAPTPNAGASSNDDSGFDPTSTTGLVLLAVAGLILLLLTTVALVGCRRRQPAAPEAPTKPGGPGGAAEGEFAAVEDGLRRGGGSLRMPAPIALTMQNPAYQPPDDYLDVEDMGIFSQHDLNQERGEESYGSMLPKPTRADSPAAAPSPQAAGAAEATPAPRRESAYTFLPGRGPPGSQDAGESSTDPAPVFSKVLGDPAREAKLVDGSGSEASGDDDFEC